jgi:hypothetical protein
MARFLVAIVLLGLILAACRSPGGIHPGCAVIATVDTDWDTTGFTAADRRALGTVDEHTE